MKGTTTTTIRFGALAGAVMLASGCASTMGMGESNLSCPYPEGDQCLSLEDAYANSIADTDARDAARAAPTALPQQAMPPRLPSGAPILSEPEILRVWVGPWEDEVGQFHDQSYVYTVVREGQWVLKRNHQAQDDRFINLQAPDTSPLVIEEEAPERMTDEEATQSAVDFLNQQANQ
ncbi:TraV family lipoprotein [Thioalkalivibrio sp. ALMg11]|uniref:TraV family lipoprotein n=1 Tax=Thioalkalivibrio sp. ALMg11 TaxID=1158165 RepID=UPI00035D6B45|nr:TraV family lipoprotein [Thioalkalivibrio sp. ALMg11]